MSPHPPDVTTGARKGATRLQGLDTARFLAFVGMVLVNFSIVMGGESGSAFATYLLGALEGKAAATFVILAGLGMGLAQQSGNLSNLTILKRSAFLLIVGLANSLIFPADILHFYALYFALGAVLIRSPSWMLYISIILLNILSVILISVLTYDRGWDWDTFTYTDFWTINGFLRNLIFNGWHPVVPWLGFLLFGLIISRHTLHQKSIQIGMVIAGLLILVATEIGSKFLTATVATSDPELAEITTTSPIPPMPLYTISGMATGLLVVGLCLRTEGLCSRLGISSLLGSAGRQSLTLYIAHIVLGMSILEEFGLTSGMSKDAAIVAGFLFSFLCIGYALLWSRFFSHGPMESLIRRLTS